MENQEGLSGKTSEMGLGKRIKAGWQTVKARFTANPLNREPTSPGEMYPGYKYRYDLFRKYVASYVDKTKPMLYYGSGCTLAEFEGSGVNTAYYVDPIYSYTYPMEAKGHKGHGLKSLYERVKSIDPNARIEVFLEDEKKHYYATINHEDTDGAITHLWDYDSSAGHSQSSNFRKEEVDIADLSGKITYQSNGEQKTINIVGKDALGYVPEEIKEKGCSVFAYIGVGIEELYPSPVKADRYVVSTAVPEAWGYKKVLKPDNWLGIAEEYERRELTEADMELLLAGDFLLMVLARMLDASSDINQFNKQIDFFRSLEKSHRDLKEISEESVLRSHFIFRIREISNLSDNVRLVALNEMREEFLKMFENKKVKNIKGQMVKRIFIDELDKVMN